MHRLAVSLPEDLFELVEKEAADRGLTYNDVIRDALTQHYLGRRHRTIGEVAFGSIRDGATNQQALAYVRKLFPETNASSASIAWYRMTLRKQGENVPTDLEARSQARWIEPTD
ncbi:MAG: ribbon-helix-helix protein, CopG family [Mobilitalea sp.]